MNIWGFIIGGAIGLIILIGVVSIAVENCEDKIEELENRIKFQDTSISELEKTAGKHICKLENLQRELTRLNANIYYMNIKIDELQNNKKDKTEEDIINEELLKYSKECAKAVEDRLNKKGDGK